MFVCIRLIYLVRPVFLLLLPPESQVRAGVTQQALSPPKMRSTIEVAHFRQVILNDGVPLPKKKKRRNANLVFEKSLIFFLTWVMEVLIGKQFGFSGVIFRVGYGAPLSEGPQKI